MRRMRKAWGYRSVLAGLVVGLTMTGGSVMAADEATPAAGQAAGQGGAAAPAQVDGLFLEPAAPIFCSFLIYRKSSLPS